MKTNFQKEVKIIGLALLANIVLTDKTGVRPERDWNSRFVGSNVMCKKENATLTFQSFYQ